MKPKFVGALIMGLLSFLFGSCSKPHSPQPSAEVPPEITADSEPDGFVDLCFAIRSHETHADGSQVLNAHGVHRGREVGIAVILGPNWKEGSLGPDVALVTYQGTITYRSVGAASDALLQVLDELYGTKLLPTTIRANTAFTAISLAGEPGDLSKGPAKIKLFFESEDDARYAELYTNIDLANRVLQIHEKDPDYRSAVIKALRPE